jgi:PAS domain-containing protein
MLVEVLAVLYRRQQLNASSIVGLVRLRRLKTFSAVLTGTCEPKFTRDQAAFDVIAGLTGKISSWTCRFICFLLPGREACFITAHDITVHENAMEQLHLRSRALDAARDAIVISHRCGESHCITYANTAFERLYGDFIEHVLGAPTQAALGWDRASQGVIHVEEFELPIREQQQRSLPQFLINEDFKNGRHFAPGSALWLNRWSLKNLVAASQKESLGGLLQPPVKHHRFSSEPSKLCSNPLSKTHFQLGCIGSVSGETSSCATNSVICSVVAKNRSPWTTTLYSGTAWSTTNSASFLP